MTPNYVRRGHATVGPPALLPAPFDESTGWAGYEACCVMEVAEDRTVSATNRFDVIRERAWTSPFWYDTARSSE